MRDLLSVDFRRVKNLFRMDLHKTIHGKAFWVMACIAVFIPVMMMTQMSEAGDVMAFIGSTGESTSGAFGAGMNLSMLTILTGILLSIQIGREYTSGSIKNIVTAHANKCDYIISKAMIATVWNVAFTVIHLLTLFILGAMLGFTATIPSIPGLILYILEKLLLAVLMSVLMIAINMIFRSSFGWSIVFVCMAGTGIVVMSLQMVLPMLGLGAISSLLNFTVTGAAVYATLSPSLLSLLLIVAVCAGWTIIYTVIGDTLMNKRDIL